MLKDLMIAGTLASLIFVATSTAKAQAAPTALAKGEFQIGAGYSFARSDYGQRNIQGISIFTDFDLGLHLGLEADAHFLSLVTPDDVGENSFLAGPRFIYRRKIVKLYAKGLLGAGDFIVENPQKHPSEVAGTNFAYALGGGIDIVVRPYLIVRAFDGEYQHYNYLSGLTPVVFTFGAAYRFH